MVDPLTRIRRGAILLFGLFVVAVFVRQVLTEGTLLDAVYWFVITVSSVGYAERSSEGPAVQWFNILVILVGMSVAAYVVGGFIQLVAAGEIERAMGVRRMTREIDELSGHTIVCGFGRLGRTIAEDLHGRGLPLVIVENNAETVAEAIDTGYLFVTGDATEEVVLTEAGIQRAKTIIVALRSDSDNVFLTLTARNLKPGIRIIARGEHPPTEKKLLQAGADRVVMPAVLGARRMAAMVSSPHAAELIDLVTDHRVLNAALEELQVGEESPWAGKSIKDAATRSRYHLLIVALRRADGNMVFNPEADLVVNVGDTAIVMGKREDIKSFCREYRL